MDEIKDEPPANEDEDNGRGAWNTVHLGILHISVQIHLNEADYF